MKTVPAPCRRRSAFTLPEVLVVIAILAILLTMLLPSLTEARDRTRITLCAANLKQWGTAYGGYASDYNGFFGGCTVYIDPIELLSSNDNIANTWYHYSPYAKSTKRLPSYGLQSQFFLKNSTIMSDPGITACPGREATNYVLRHGQGKGLRRVWLAPFESSSFFCYVDYFVFTGFATTGGEDDKTFGWNATYGWNQGDLFSPVTHLRQRRSSRAVMVMDRSWVSGLSTSSYFYNDIGDTSSHVWRNMAPAYVGAPQVATGGNALLLDGSVQWMDHRIKEDVLPYGRDYYRSFYIHKTIAK